MTKIEIGTIVSIATAVICGALWVGILEGRVRALEGRGALKSIEDAKVEAIRQIQASGALVGSTAGSAPGGVPVGTIVPFGGELTEETRAILVELGWLPCDGGFASRNEFPELFAVLGTAWGADGDTTYNVPDLRGLFLRGVDGEAERDPDKGRRTESKSGGNTGNEVGSVQEFATAMPVTAFKTGINEESHTHSYSIRGGSFGDGVGAASWYSHFPEREVRASSGESQPHVHSVSTGGDAETRPRNAYVNWLIKAR